MKHVLLLITIAFLLISCGEETTSPNMQNTPTDLNLTLVNATAIRVKWTDNSDVEIGFILQRRHGEESFAVVDSLPANTEEYLDENLQNNTVYYYRIASILENENSEWSNIATIQTHSTISDMTFGETGKLEFITWNIEKFPKEDETTINYVAEVIYTLQPDIIAMQEMGSEYDFTQLWQKIDEMDDGNEWLGDWEQCDSYGNNLAFIYNSSVLESVVIYRILENDWYAFPRPPFVLEADYNEQHFIVINNHLKAMGDNDSVDRRRQACLKLDQYVTEHHPDDNVIILGDLNDSLTDPEASNVFWNFIENNSNYLFTDMEIAEGSSDNWSYYSWPSHLDHILITNELFDEFENIGSIVNTILIDHFMNGGFDEYNQYISDHRPVGLKLSFD